MALTDKLTAIAEAIRGKTGKTDAMTLEQMATEIEGISAGGGDSLAKGIIERTVTEISDDTVTSVGRYAFYYNTTLTSVNFPDATSIDISAFYNCYQLTSVNLPKAETFYANAFRGCSKLRIVNASSVLQIDGSAFYDCNSLVSVKFPVLASLGDYAFQSCKKLETADLGTVGNIGDRSFNSCSALHTLVIRKDDTVCALTGQASLTSSKIENGTGYIYVPSALVDTYKAATNWSNFASQFRALEDYTVDGTTTGELDPNKTGVTA